MIDQDRDGLIGEGDLAAIYQQIGESPLQGQGHGSRSQWWWPCVWWPNMTLIIDVLWLEYFFDFRVATICRATISMETNADDNNDAQYLEKI